MITLKELKQKNQQNTAIFLCKICDVEYSANPADYFWMKENEVFTCFCGEKPTLVYKKLIYCEVK